MALEKSLPQHDDDAAAGELAARHRSHNRTAVDGRNPLHQPSPSLSHRRFHPSHLRTYQLPSDADPLPLPSLFQILVCIAVIRVIPAAMGGKSE